MKYLHIDSPLWVLIQQVAGRVAVALKFLILAKLLGPEAMGLIGVALLGVAFVESVSDTGLSQGLLQARQSLNADTLSVLWSYQLLRGVLLCSIMFFSAVWISEFLRAPKGAILLQLISVVLIFRNATSIGFYLSQRGQDYKRTSLFASAFTIFDFIFGVCVAYIYKSTLSVVLSMVIVECLKCFFSYIFFFYKVKINFNYKKIKEIQSFGKWIWLNSILVFCLNQLDKILVSRIIGVVDLGVYQMASRLSQLAVADLGVAMGNFLFTRLSYLFREDNERAGIELIKAFNFVLTFSLLSVFVIAILGEAIISSFLGSKWLLMVEPLRILSIGMIGGAITAVCVAFIKADGRPHIIAVTSIIQLVLSAPIMYFSGINFGMIGISYAVVFSIWISTLILMTDILKRSSFFYRYLKEGKWKYLSYVLLGVIVALGCMGNIVISLICSSVAVAYQLYSVAMFVEKKI